MIITNIYTTIRFFKKKVLTYSASILWKGGGPTSHSHNAPTKCVYDFNKHDFLLIREAFDIARPQIVTTVSSPEQIKLQVKTDFYIHDTERH